MSGEILGIGVDVVDIDRLARVRAERPIMQRVMAPEEAHLLPLTDESAAVVWATKEAVAKTLGTGFWQQGVEWSDIRLLVDGTVGLYGKAAQVAGSSTVELEQELIDAHMVVRAIRRGPR